MKKIAIILSVAFVLGMVTACHHAGEEHDHEHGHHHDAEQYTAYGADYELFAEACRGSRFAPEHKYLVCEKSKYHDQDPVVGIGHDFAHAEFGIEYPEQHHAQYECDAAPEQITYPFTMFFVNIPDLLHACLSTLTFPSSTL